MCPLVHPIYSGSQLADEDVLRSAGRKLFSLFSLGKQVVIFDRRVSFFCHFFLLICNLGTIVNSVSELSLGMYSYPIIIIISIYVFIYTFVRLCVPDLQTSSRKYGPGFMS
ncbi:hypothetical protein BDV98DRAFT_15420 [Pterulicium gracile]|uniref:Uncharacterized protein n=1 Tax=Pterulicium gracile TaxID=1884261 RepID=A0A5C3QZ72_9AGAR|nr:hypothetical protein BDV98DRAFT_15420 [Pterula gracilis]